MSVQTDKHAEHSPQTSFVLWYRCFLGLGLVLLFLIQKPIEVRLGGRGRLFLGYFVSISFLLLVIEYPTLFFFNTFRRLRQRLGSERLLQLGVLICASLFLTATLFSNYLHGFAVAPYAPSRSVALIVLLLWFVFAGLVFVRRLSTRVFYVGLVVLVFLTRLLTVVFNPFWEIGGDMLRTIDLSLDYLREGEFPYAVGPPLMPYFPLTFLFYAPPYFLGLDLRVTNLFLEPLIVALVLFLPRHARNSVLNSEETLGLARVALPLLFLLPSWVDYGTNTQYPPSMLLTVLFGWSVCYARPSTQAIVLAFAILANQTFAVFAFILGPFWLNQHGWKATCRLTGLALIPFLVFVSPFLLWDAPQFIHATMTGLKPFDATAFAGHFTLLPLVAERIPHASHVFIVGATFLGAGIAYRRKTPEAVVILTAVVYCVVLLFLHRIFSHYFLPVLALITTCSLPANNEAERH